MGCPPAGAQTAEGRPRGLEGIGLEQCGSRSIKTPDAPAFADEQNDTALFPICRLAEYTSTFVSMKYKLDAFLMQMPNYVNLYNIRFMINLSSIELSLYA